MTLRDKIRKLAESQYGIKDPQDAPRPPVRSSRERRKLNDLTKRLVDLANALETEATEVDAEELEDLYSDVRGVLENEWAELTDEQELVLRKDTYAAFFDTDIAAIEKHKKALREIAEDAAKDLRWLANVVP